MPMKKIKLILTVYIEVSILKDIISDIELVIRHSRTQC